MKGLFLMGYFDDGSDISALKKNLICEQQSASESSLTDIGSP